VKQDIVFHLDAIEKALRQLPELALE